MRATFQEPQSIEVRAPLGGLVSAGTQDLLRDQDFARLVNWHMDQGGLTKRRGRFMVATLPEAREGWAIWHYRTDAAKKLFIVAGEHLIFIPEGGGAPVGAVSGVWPPTADDVIGNAKQLGAFVQWGGYLFYADGGPVKNAYTPTGTILPWGYQGGAIPAPTDSGAAAGGSLTASKWYGVAIAYRDPVRQITSNFSARVVFQVPAAVNFTEDLVAGAFAGWSSPFSEIVIARTLATADATQAAEESLFEDHVDTGVVALPHNFSVSKADDQLGEEPVDELGSEPPPDMDFACLYRAINRIIGFKGSHFYFSKEGTEEGGVWVFPGVNDVPIALDAGDPINGCFEMQGQVYTVLRGAGVFLLAPVETEDGLSFRVQAQTGAAVGCVARFSILVRENYAYWIDDVGIVEFDGTNARYISDEPGGGRAGIRDLFVEYRDTGRLAKAFGVIDRQPDKRYLRWFVPRDSIGSDGLTYFTADELVFDLTERTWHVERAGGDPAADRVSGLYGRAMVQYRDASADENRGTWVYQVDEDGNVYRLRSDEAGREVYTDNGSDVVAEFWTKQYGDGLGQILPLTVDVEMVRSLFDHKGGDLTLSLYRDGFDLPPYEETFPLFDETTSDKASDAVAMNFNRKPCRRFAIGGRHSGSDGDLTLVGLRPRFQVLGRTLRGS